MMRVTLAATACAACTTDGTTGPATLTVDGTQIAMAAVMYPAQTVEPINGEGRYAGWTVGFVTDPPGACPDPARTDPVGFVAFISGRLETSLDDIVITTGAFPIVRNVPDPLTEKSAVAVAGEIGLESGSAAITVFDRGERMEGTLSGVGTDSATTTTVSVSGTFTAYPCAGW